jgi:hypothetical protein
MFIKTDQLGHHEIMDGDFVGRGARFKFADRRPVPISNEARKAASDPHYQKGTHKLLIENKRFHQLTQAERDAINHWRQVTGKPPFQGD